MAKKTLTFLANGIDTLEKRIIASVLRKHEMTLTDFRPQLKDCTDEELHAFMRVRVAEGVVCVLPGVPLDRFQGQDYLEQVTVLSPDNIAGGMSVLAQICAIIGHQPSRYENLVSAFAFGHIKSLRAAGATEEEVKQICLRDRLARGCSLQDESAVAEYVRELQPIVPHNSTLVHEAIIYHDRGSALDRPECQMAFLDYLLGQADGYGVFTTIIDHCDEDYHVAQADIYTNSLKEVAALECAAGKLHYVMTTRIRHARTGLWHFRLVMVKNSRPVRAFYEELVKYRRPKY